MLLCPLVADVLSLYPQISLSGGGYEVFFRSIKIFVLIDHGNVFVCDPDCVGCGYLSLKVVKYFYSLYQEGTCNKM